MTALIACAWSLLRALLIALLVLGASARVATLLSGRLRGLTILVLAMIALMPPLVIAYAWAAGAWSPVHRAWAVDAFYVIVVAARLLPLGVLAWCAVPIAHGDRRAWHQAHLLAPRVPASRRVRWWLQAHARPAALAAALVFLAAFNEFELASLFSLPAWSVWTFDAQATGMPISEALVAAWPALVLQALVLIPVILLITRTTPAEWQPPLRRSRSGVVILGLATVLVLVVPLLVCLLGFSQAGLQGFTMTGEMASSLFIGVSVALMAVSLVTGVLSLSPRARRVGMILAIIPSLLGSLTLGLVGLQVTAAVPQLRGGWAPVCTMVLLAVLPWVVVAGAIMLRYAPASLHQARLYPAQRWRRWVRLGSMPLLLLFTLAFVLAYGDLAASAILIPLGETPVSARLYNLMHYGRTDALSALVVASLLLPLLGAGLVWCLGSALARRVIGAAQ